MTDHGKEQFKPNTTVAAIIHCNNKYLLVKEIENNQHVFNQPAGHLEENESLVSACQREVFEETGLRLMPDYVSGIYYFYRADINLHYLRFCFVIEVDDCYETSPQDDDILSCHWMTLEQINEQSQAMRSDLVIGCINDYLTNKKNNIKIELASLKSNLN